MKTKLSIFCEKIIEAGWLAAVVTVPVFFNIYSARTFEPDKITLLRSIVSLMILAWIVMVVEQGRGGSEKFQTPLPDRLQAWLKIPLFLPTLLMVIVYIISTIFSISPPVSLWGSYQRMQGTYSFLSYIVVFALMVGNLRTREQVDRLVATIIITSIPISLYGIIQRYGLDPLPWAGNVTIRVASNMGNAIFVASYLIMVMPITISRLIEAMMAIIREEKASWGHTILAAVYIFALAVQALTVVFSQSRGPMLGILAASLVMGLLFLLVLRRRGHDDTRLLIREIGNGLGFVVPLGLMAGLGGGIGYLLGLGFEQLLYVLNYQADNVALLGAALGGLLGFLGLYTYLAASGKSWRWLWLSWIGLAIVGICFVLTLNIRGTPLDSYLDPLRQLPYVSRLANVIETSRTGKVRVLIWDAVLELIAAHEPLGIEGDDFSEQDSFNLIRPLVGYGPESMFNAFAFVYPPELAHVEVRGSSADRSHNETMDSLVITGVIGFGAFYFLMITLFYYALRWLGWVADGSDRRRLLILLISGGIIGSIIPYIVDGKFTFMPLGLPFGLMTGIVIYLVWQGILPQRKFNDNQHSDRDGGEHLSYHLLLIGLLGAIIGHFIEVHFVFSIAATYTYFWTYAGLMVAISRIMAAKAELTPETTSSEEAAPEEQPVEPAASRRSRRGRARRGNARKQARVGISTVLGKQESWEMWLGAMGLAMAIILIILAFDFINPRLFDDSEQFMSFVWMLVITWLIGFGVAMSSLAIRRDDWPGHINWGWAALLYSVTSLFFFIFYAIVHRSQIGQQITGSSMDDVIKGANIQANGFVMFYVALFVLLMIIGITLTRGLPKNLTPWRSENWWLYPPLVITIVAVIWFKNINVVRADIYLKQGEQYRSRQLWNEAIELHKKGLSLDSDEDFYYLMLALDYQLMAQDGRVEPGQRELAWREGERIALQARELNPYNPDNTGNMGRYYFTLGQIFDQQRFQDALDYFQRATVLAPSNIVYHNLWAQTHYILKNYAEAIDRLQTSVSIDPNYAPTWLLLGDTYAAMGKVDQALMAHREALKLSSQGSGDGFAGFADQFVGQRLNFYISAGRGEDILTALQQVVQNRPDDARAHWVIGQIYNLQGNKAEAIPYFERALALGESSDQTLKDLASLYLSQNQLDQALSAYQLFLERNPDDVEANSALAFIFAQQGQVDEAIRYNQIVLQHLPDDYDSLKNLALLYQRKGDLRQAYEAARQAQAVAPEAERPSWDQIIADLESKLAESG